MVGELVMDLVPGMPCDNGAKVADGANWRLGDHQGRRLSLEIAPDWGLTHVSSCMGYLRHARLWFGSQRKVSAARRPRASPTAGLDPATPQCFDTAPRSIHWHVRPHLISAH